MEILMLAFLSILCSVNGGVFYKFSDIKGVKEFPKDFPDSSTSFLDDTATFLVIDPDKMYLPGVLVNLQISKVKLNEVSGDLLIVGPGNHKNVFDGAPGLIYVQGQSSTQNFQVIGKMATIIFVTRKSSNERNLKIEWEIIGKETNATVTTPLPTTPVSEADMKALILCFMHNGSYTCDQFDQNRTDRFKRSLRNRAQQYIEKNNIDVVRNLRPDDVRVNCFVVENEDLGTKRRQNNYLSVTITDSRNPELPVFTTQQLREIVKDFHNDEGSLGAAECRSFPNYWWWFYGSAIMLGIVMILLSVCWWYARVDSENMYVKDKKEAAPEAYNCNGVINKTFKGDNDEYFYETKGPHNDHDFDTEVPPITPQRNKEMDFSNVSLTNSPPNSPNPRKKYLLNRDSSKTLLPTLPSVNEDTYRESAPSVASQEFTPDHSPQPRRNENDSSNVYEELDTYVRPLSTFGQIQDTLF